MRDNKGGLKESFMYDDTPLGYAIEEFLKPLRQFTELLLSDFENPHWKSCLERGLGSSADADAMFSWPWLYIGEIERRGEILTKMLLRINDELIDVFGDELGNRVFKHYESKGEKD